MYTFLNTIQIVPTVGLITKVKETPFGRMYTIDYKDSNDQIHTIHTNKINEAYQEGDSVAIKYVYLLGCKKPLYILNIDDELQIAKLILTGIVCLTAITAATVGAILAGCYLKKTRESHE